MPVQDLDPDLIDQSLPIGRKELHYVFEVPDAASFLHAWLGKDRAQIEMTRPLPMILNFRDNVGLAEDGINIVTKEVVSKWDAIKEYVPEIDKFTSLNSGWYAIEEDVPEVHKFTLLNNIGTQAYFLHDPFSMEVKDNNELDLMNKTISFSVEDIMKQQFTLYDVKTDVIAGVYEGKGVNMDMLLYHINPGTTYVDLQPTINSHPDLQGNNDNKKLKHIKNENNQNAIALMQEFCNEGILKRMLDMPQQFIQKRLQSMDPK